MSPAIKLLATWVLLAHAHCMASLTMHEVSSVRTSMIEQCLERDQKYKRSYLYVPSHESTALAGIVNSYLPLTYAQIIQGRNSFIISPTEGIIWLKKRPGKTTKTFSIEKPEEIYSQKTECVGLALSPNKNFLTVVAKDNNHFTYYQYIIKHQLLRSGLCIFNQSINAQELGAIVGINCGNENPGIEFENCFFRTAIEEADTKRFADLQASSSEETYNSGVGRLNMLSKRHTFLQNLSLFSTIIVGIGLCTNNGLVITPHILPMFINWRLTRKISQEINNVHNWTYASRCTFNKKTRNTLTFIERLEK